MLAGVKDQQSTQPMKTTQHTPTPIRATEGSYGHYIAIVDANGKTIARVPWGEGDGQHAALIVRAVNSHAALVDALWNTFEHLRLTIAEHHRLLEVHGYAAKGHPLDEPVLDKARAALALAKE